MSEKVLRWFEKRIESKATQMLLEQMDLVSKASHAAIDAVQSAVRGDVEEAGRKIALTDMLETEADTLRRRIIQQLAGGELRSEDRFDFMRLARAVDLVADWSLESCRSMSTIWPRFSEIMQAPDAPKQVLNEFVEKILACVDRVHESLDQLFQRNVENALRLADEVERIEEEVDELYQEARKAFLAYDSQRMSVGERIAISQLLDALENVTDRCEDSCDQIRVIAVRAVA